MTEPLQPHTPAPPKNETVFFGKGMIAVIIAIVALLAILLVVSTMGGSPGQGPVVPASTCADKAVAYANTYLVQPGSMVTLVSVNETRGLYQVMVRYQSRDMPLYTTKDCSLLFTSSLNMNAAKATPTPVPEPKKTDRPAVELYVMAFCPYGTQAETVMRPVYDLLGSKADIRVRYITYGTGASIDSLSSLHGPAEAKEDAYQICVMKSEPANYWEYLRLFNEQCYPSWQDSGSLAACRKNVTDSLNLGRTTIESCAAGADAIGLLRNDQDASNSYGASASPTLIINGVQYYGPRTPEAYKQAVCNSFATAPAECSTTLSTVSPGGATGGCG